MESTQTNTDIQLIDLDGVFKKQRPVLYKFIPGFVLNYLKRLIRQDEMNEIIQKYADKEGLEFAKEVLKHMNVSVKFIGIENVQKGKQYVFASNHPAGGLEGILLLNLISENFGSVKAVINELLLYLKKFRPLFTGVNIFGHNTREQLKAVDELYASENQVLVFPAGLVSRKNKGIIQDLKWKKSFLTKAIQYKRDIVPIFVEGCNSNRFYRLARIRKFFRIKANIEMILLPDEQFRHVNDTFTVHFGKPIPYQTFDNTHSHDEWADKLKQLVYALGKGETYDLK